MPYLSAYLLDDWKTVWMLFVRATREGEAMTDLDVRKIAQRLIIYNTNPHHFALVDMVSATDIAGLLDALVEDRRYKLYCEFMLTHSCYENNPHCERHSWGERDWRIQAIKELGLEGVWPIGKDKRNEKTG